MKVGDRIGSFLLESELGEGGLGKVFAAWDERLERHVALKVLHAEQADAENRARMLREARILSQLEHPGICRVYELVEHQGRDILVLELVPGRDLRRVELEAISRERKLDLAIAIAEALAAAHRLGIVHRDLKPGNVMLDEQGRIKILDFGLARRSEEPQEVTTPEHGTPEHGTPGATPSHEDSSLTCYGALVGTAIAMSPEQARGEPVTTASDLYSFGLLLQELFTGVSPYERGLTWHQLLIKAREGDARPATGLEEPLARLVADLRQMRPGARPTAFETLARLRHLRDRPKRIARRLAWAAVALLVVAAGLKYTLDLRREHNRAIEARALAEQSKRDAEEVTNFLIGLFRGADPLAEQGKAPTAAELLRRGADRIEKELVNDPSTQARLMTALSSTYRNLGAIDEGESLARGAVAKLEAQGRAGPDLADALLALGAIERERVLPSAEATLRRVIAMHAELPGTPPRQAAEAISNLAIVRAQAGAMDEAKELFGRVLEMRRAALGPSHPEVARALANLSAPYLFSGDPETAERLQREAIAIGEQLGEASPDLATHRATLGYLLNMQKRWVEGERVNRQALAGVTAALGPDHPRVRTIEVNLAFSLAGLERFAEANALLRAAVAQRERVFGRTSLPFAFTILNLAHLLVKEQSYAEAAGLAREALEIFGELEFTGPEAGDARDLLDTIAASAPRGDGSAQPAGPEAGTAGGTTGSGNQAERIAASSSRR